MVHTNFPLSDKQMTWAISDITSCNAMMIERTISIVDVAREAGVGLGTVSRVINDAEAVSPAMRQRVHETMVRLNYVPKRSTDRPGPKRRRGLGSSKQPGVIELVYENRIHLGVVDSQAPIYEQVFEGFESVLKSEGLDLIVRQVGDPQDGYPDPLPQTIGRIYFVGQPSVAMPPGFHGELPSVWVLGTPPLWYSGDTIFIDHRTVGRLAAREALVHGCRECMFIGFSAGSSDQILGVRAEAFGYWIREAGGRVRELADPLFKVHENAGNAIDAAYLQSRLLPFLAAGPWPEAIFVQADIFLPSVYRALKAAPADRGPHPLIISGNNEPRYRRGLTPAPIIIDVQGQGIGRLAMETLLWRIQHPHKPAVIRSLLPVVLPTDRK